MYTVSELYKREHDMRIIMRDSHSSLTVPIWAEIWSQGFMSQIFLALIFSQSTISQVQNPKILTRKFLLVQKLSHFEDGYLKNSEKSLKNDLWMV